MFSQVASSIGLTVKMQDGEEDSADTLIGAAPQEQARFRAAPQYSCCFARDFLDCFNEGVDTANFFGNDRMDTSGLRQSTKLV